VRTFPETAPRLAPSAVGFDHNKVIATAARAKLRPLGFKQRGRSRTWLADHGWWLAVVEFQASQWSRGSYLNVGAMWLWQPVPQSSPYPDVYRRIDEAGYVEASDEENFTQAGSQLAEIAAREAQRLRGAVSDDAAALALILDSDPGAAVRHPDLHAGITAGRLGRWDEAEQQLAVFVRRAARHEASYPDADVSMLSAQRTAVEKLCPLIGTDDFSHTVSKWIAKQREWLRLPEGQAQ